MIFPKKLISGLSILLACTAVADVAYKIDTAKKIDSFEKYTQYTRPWYFYVFQVDKFDYYQADKELAKGTVSDYAQIEFPKTEEVVRAQYDGLFASEGGKGTNLTFKGTGALAIYVDDRLITFQPSTGAVQNIGVDLRGRKKGEQYRISLVQTTLKSEKRSLSGAFKTLGKKGAKPQDFFKSCVVNPKYVDHSKKLFDHLINQKINNALTDLQHATPEAFERSVKYLNKRYRSKYVNGKNYLAEIPKYRAQYELALKLLRAKDAKGMEVLKELNAYRKKVLVDENPAIDFDSVLAIKTNKFNLESNFIGTQMGNRHGFDNEIVTFDIKSGDMKKVYKPSDDSKISEIHLHYDADKLLFSGIDQKKKFQVMEVNMDGSGKRVVSKIEGPHVDNYNGIYLPDGDIIFSSTASMAGVPCVMGNYTVPNLFRMDDQGNNARQLTFEQDSDWYPSVLADGQIMYLRWEYTDIMHYYSRIMMKMRPDGTNQRSIYGSQSLWPNAMMFAKPIPKKPSQYVAIVGGHHGFCRAGQMVIFDTSKGYREDEGVVGYITGYGKKIVPYTLDYLVDRVWPKFAHPTPINDKYFLVSGKLSASSRWRIYLVDVFDNIIPITEDSKYLLAEPYPVRKTKKQPVLAPKVNLDSSEATVYIQNIYKGEGLPKVPVGTVKELRLFTYVYGYYLAGNHNFMGIESSWDVKRILGTVKVEADGSCMFKIPADTTIAVQPLDKDGNAIQLMRSWLVAMPGETLSCIGCHETPHEAPVATPTIASNNPAQSIIPNREVVAGFSYEKEIQPILDAHCIKCHNGKNKIIDLKSKKLVDKRNSLNFSTSYFNLHPFFRRPGPESDAYMPKPYEYHISTSEAYRMLEKGHHGVKLDKESKKRLAQWVDLNTPYYGSWSDTFRDTKKDWTKFISDEALRLRKLYTKNTVDYENDSPVPYPITATKEEGIKKMAPRPAQAEGWPFSEKVAQELQTKFADKSITIDLGPTKEVKFSKHPEGIVPGDRKAALFKTKYDSKLTFVRIPAGTFVMGSDEESRQEQPQHVVTIEKPFWMSTTELTNAQVRTVLPDHDSMVYNQSWKDHTRRGYAANLPSQPAVRISWEEANQVCQLLSKKFGKKFNLPTEAQWEWACRAGSDKPFSFGDFKTDFSKYANLADKSIEFHATMGVNPYHRPNLVGNKLVDFIPRDSRFDDKQYIPTGVGQFKPNSVVNYQHVRRKYDSGLYNEIITWEHDKVVENKPNAWGLYDMHGNVAEWTRSDYVPYPYSSDESNSGKASVKKVARGGSWRDRPQVATSTYRTPYEAWQPVYNVGIRLIIEE